MIYPETIEGYSNSVISLTYDTIQLMYILNDLPSLKFKMIARMRLFLGLSFLAKLSCDYCMKSARQSHDVREAVAGNQCSQFHRANTV